LNIEKQFEELVRKQRSLISYRQPVPHCCQLNKADLAEAIPSQADLSAATLDVEVPGFDIPSP
jgi:hypothetical protein